MYDFLRKVKKQENIGMTLKVMNKNNYQSRIQYSENIIHEQRKIKDISDNRNRTYFFTSKNVLRTQ